MTRLVVVIRGGMVEEVITDSKCEVVIRDEDCEGSTGTRPALVVITPTFDGDAVAVDFEAEAPQWAARLARS